MEYVEIGARRDAYSVEDIINRTLTVGELIEILEDFDESTPVVLSHDGGYTYGAIHASRITAEETDAEMDEDYEEEELKADDLFDESWDNSDSKNLNEECLHCDDDDNENDDEDDKLECDDDFGEHENSYNVDEAYSFKGLNDIFGGKTLAESLRPREIKRKKK